MKPYLIHTAAVLAGGALLLALTARAESPKKDHPENVPVTGSADPDLAPLDDAMKEVLHEHHIPGGAAVAARNGKVVYARGFGYADLAEKDPVEPDALFRIASVSKPFTAVAVLQLVERGKLSLDDKVFDVLELEALKGPKVKFDDRWNDITLLDLLHHRGGWDRDKSFDPMFRSALIVKELDIDPPAQPDDIVRYMLRRPLDFDPGTRYAYSNFGYILLGRVIEKVTGMRYEDYVKKNIFEPLGIEHMRQGKTLLKDRAPGEVRYYCDGEGPAVLGPRLGKSVPWPYGAWSLEALDSAGGWIAPAEDLVRFASAFDDPEHCKILNAAGVKTLFAPAPGDEITNDGKSHYACGWWVRAVGDGKRTMWHVGSLDGTSALLVRRWDGLTYAALFNSRKSALGHEPSEGADSLLDEAANEVKHWPDAEDADPK